MKPYACTFAFCDKKFGSKNDWKRHENSQHYQHELWKCNEKTDSNPDSICGKPCHRREQFRAHLAKDHSIMSPSTVDSKLEQCQVGQNCDSSFWCGFCNKVIDVEEKGLKAWASRFNHIDDHFSGRGRPKMDISQWKRQESVPSETSSRFKSSTPGSTAGDLAMLSPAPFLEAHRAGKASKRFASDETQHQPPRKRERLLYYCVSKNSGMQILSFANILPKSACVKVN